MNNFQNKCGKCNQDLINDYVVKINTSACKYCGGDKNFEIQYCNQCIGQNLNRGEIKLSFVKSKS